MITIKEILDIEMNGKNTIKEERELNEICSCVDSLTGIFEGTKRAESAISGLSGKYVDELKRAISTMKVYEKKALNEEEMSDSAARILLYDVQKYLQNSYKALTESKREYKLMNKENIARAYSSIIFEQLSIAKERGIYLDNIISDEALYEQVSDDMAKIVNEVL